YSPTGLSLVPYFFFDFGDVDFSTFQVRQASTNLAEPTEPDDADLHTSFNAPLTENSPGRCHSCVRCCSSLFKRDTFWHWDQLFRIDFSLSLPTAVNAVAKWADHWPNSDLVAGLPIGHALTN